MKNDKLNSFSVPLGLLDYVNPLCYSVTMIVILTHLFNEITIPYNIILLIGAIVSVLCGLVIPTGKVLVGLGKIQFKMPVGLVLAVNSGILLTGLMLIKYVLTINTWIIIGIILIVLGFIIISAKKLNSIAVLIGAIGYLMIYISLIILSLRASLVAPIILYGFAIALFIMLVCIGIKGNLKNPKVHWLIESSNVICQMCVMIGTLLLF